MKSGQQWQRCCRVASPARVAGGRLADTLLRMNTSLHGMACAGKIAEALKR